MKNFHSECLLCRSLIPSSWSSFLQYLCPTCFGRSVVPQSYNAEELCPLCSMPNPSRGDFCEDCGQRPWDFCELRGIFPYASSSSEILRRYKFEPLPELAADLGEIALAHFWPRAPIVTVPTTVSRTRRRGWNPVERWARTISRKARVPYWNLLEKNEVAAQKTLSKVDRFESAAHSFRLRAKVPRQARSVDFVWLLDDVVTTGASVQACAKLLKESGIKSIKVLSLSLH